MKSWNALSYDCGTSEPVLHEGRATLQSGAGCVDEYAACTGLLSVTVTVGLELDGYRDAE